MSGRVRIVLQLVDISLVLGISEYLLANSRTFVLIDDSCSIFLQVCAERFLEVNFMREGKFFNEASGLFVFTLLRGFSPFFLTHGHLQLVVCILCMLRLQLQSVTNVISLQR